ncbi:uncharacterized protein LOC119554160 [Drosophila subpulchrella]|uniref:uncharacterized protein LOC119554160 n=1 Tax=Drosophila subpulchrella TaxID=1486046 RepID=UPI0018A18A01|nr:uncharacterized protein LOC119554160 [Drosophila subpulchrella]
MFESISFLFLFALAFVAWVLLCFQHVVQVQTRGSSDFRVELYTEHPGITFEPQLCHSPSEQSPSGGAYEFAKSFGVIFAMTLGLSKVLQLAEVQVKSYLKCRDALPSRSASQAEEFAHEQQTPCQPNPSNPSLMDHNEELKEQLSILQSQCLVMRDLLQELRNSSSSSSYESVECGRETPMPHPSEESIVLWKRSDSITDTVSGSSHAATRSPNSQPGQNIFISHSHIHINSSFYLTENRVNVDLCRQASMYTRKRSEFYQVYGKYIRGPGERPSVTGMRCNNILL